MERLRVLFDLALIDTPEEMVYDQLTQLASAIIGTPVALVSLVASNYQFFKSQVGLPEPWKSKRRTPLSHSFCQHVVMRQEPLIITDARLHPLVRNNMAIPDLAVIGYLGIPLTLKDGNSLGSFCVIDSEPREWTQLEIDIMHELAGIVTTEFNTRALVKAKKLSEDALTSIHGQIVEMIEHLKKVDSKKDFLVEIKQARVDYEL